MRNKCKHLVENPCSTHQLCVVLRWYQRETAKCHSSDHGCARRQIYTNIAVSAHTQNYLLLLFNKLRLE